MTPPLRRIGIDVAQLSDKALTGIPLYIESLLRELVRKGGASEQFLLYGSQKGTNLTALMQERGLDEAAQAMQIVPGVDLRLTEAFPALRRRSGAIQWLLRKIDGRVLMPASVAASSLRLSPPVDVFHHTSVLRLRPSRARRHIVTIYDLTTRFYPETHNPGNIYEWERVFAFARDRADRIIADSESARQDIIEHLKIPGDRVQVIPLGVRPLPGNLGRETVQAVRQKFGLTQNRRFVLAAGSLEPRKNLPRLIEAFARLTQEPGMDDVRLTLTGARLHGAAAVDEAIATHRMQERVILAGYVSDEALAALMQSCDCFIYPSLYEGFGLPVLEAMAMGAPVITSNLSSLPEVTGDAALLIDPKSVEAIADGMRRVLSDGDLAADLRRRGIARAARFSWARCAEEHLRLYREVAGH